MKFTLSWLKDHLDTDASLEAITEALTDVGLEVEEVVDPAAKLADFKVAEIVSAEQHPDADRLRVCRVNTGADTIQVVCGAPNARAGLVGVFAPTGTYVPGSDLWLKPTKIRGVESSGMMCSARELELGDDHDGIIELEGDFVPGQSAADALGANDPVIEIAITPNRPDCLGVYGIARDLAAAGIGKLKASDARQGVAQIEGEGECPIDISLDFAAGTETACPAFAGRLVRGVKNGPSPKWMQDRLKAIGLRPISALVDITNYVMFDRGRPLHVYDAATLKGAIGARLARSGETLEALDDKTYELDTQICVICDDSGAIGLGGVMGGASTGCTDKTVDVFIESAAFDPIRIARTGRVLNINSDARYRFERGVDPGFLEAGLDLATQLVVELCGGTPTVSKIAGEVPRPSKSLTLDPKRIGQLTGVELAAEKATGILDALGFDPQANENQIAVRVPSWRPDIDGQADLVEEVVRIEGLGAVPSTPMVRPPVSAPSPITPAQARVRQAKRAAAAAGLLETVNWSFISRAQAELFGAPQGGGELTLANPISQEMSTMRPGLLPGLLAALRRNQARGESDINLFEVGQSFSGDQPKDQAMVAAAVRTGNPRRHWSAGQTAYDVFDAKADILALLAAVGGPASPQISRDAPEWYHPGRSGVLRLGPKLVLGYFGELHPSIQKAFEIDTPVVAMELFLDAVPAPKSKAGAGRPPLVVSELMPLWRDFAFLVDQSVEAETLLAAARKAGKALVDQCSVFDIFEGTGIPRR